MPINVVFKRSLSVNGREYGDLDQIAPEQREAVAKAMEAATALAPGEPGIAIVVNGSSYAGVDEVPPELRDIVRDALAAAAARATASVAPRGEAGGDRPIAADPPFAPRKIVLAAGVLLLLLLLARIVF